MDDLDIEATRDKADNLGHQYALKAGDVLDQHRVIRPLGAGGMGEVYLVENIHNHKHFALKVLPPVLSKDAQFVGRFKIESRVMMDLDHPNIVRVHHIGEAQGLYYLTMDYIGSEKDEPQTLEDLLGNSKFQVPGSKLTEDGVRAIALQICDALEYAHSKGIVHRDLKPSNILISPSTITHEPLTIRISDFGLAKVLGQAYLSSIIERSVSLSIGGQVSLGEQVTQGRDGSPNRPRYEKTSTRSILGTYDYMSPEQKTGGEITPRSDIYALGMMLYRMLTGRKAEGRFKLPSAFGCAKKWDTIVSRCLEPDPKDRFASTTEVAHHLRSRRSTAFGAPVRILVLALAVAGAAAGLLWIHPSIKATPEIDAAGVDPAAQKPAHPAQEATITGSIAVIRPPRPENAEPWDIAVTVQGGRTRRVVLPEEVYRELPSTAKLGLAPGTSIVAKGTVEAPGAALIVSRAADLLVLSRTAGAIYTNALPIKVVQQMQLENTVTIRGTLGRRRAVKGGLVFAVFDDTGSADVVFWDRSVSQRVRDALQAGRTVLITGVIKEFKGYREIVPSKDEDIRVQ